MTSSIFIGVSSTFVAVLLSVLWLETEDRLQLSRILRIGYLIYLPLLLPQIAFMSGLNIMFLKAHLSGNVLGVIWVHFMFVFPYVMITLSDPWRTIDPRIIRTAAALGAPPWRRFFKVKLPLLLRPILTVAAIGFAVSFAQYLPTLFIGAGRVQTLTTEAVALASSSDRRVVGLYAFLQAAIPFIVFIIALKIPNWIFHNRAPFIKEKALA